MTSNVSNTAAPTTNPRPIRAVVFDLDGLMVNTEEIFNEVGREVLRRRDKEMTHELLSLMMGRRAPEAIGNMIEYHKLTDSVEELIEETRILFYELIGERLAPMPGLFELLSHIEAFQTTLTAEDVTHGKPAPEIYLKAAERLGVSPDEMMVLEDSQAGTTAGVSAGAVVVSVPHEHSRQHDLSHATYIAARLDDPWVLERLSVPRS